MVTDILSFIGQRLINLVLIASLVLSPSLGYAQNVLVSTLPEPGRMVGVSQAFTPILVKGLVIHPDKPLDFGFIVDSGNDSTERAVIKEQSEKIVRYFLAALTVPEGSLWVNLSPYENDRIIPAAFGLTEMGRDLLAQDYVLKQLTASLMYPESGFGKELWRKIYAAARQKYGTTNIPVDTFNKVWIMPDEATVYVSNNTAVIKSCHLKVMLETDYLAEKQGVRRPSDPEGFVRSDGPIKAILRESVIPILEKEVNEGRNFALLRQIFHAMVLATWFKRNFKKTLVGQVYADKNKVQGIDLAGKGASDHIWRQYVAAFKQGVFNYIKEEYDATAHDLVSRKYFSGGFRDNPEAVHEVDASQEQIAAVVAASLGKVFVAEANLRPETREGSPDLSQESSAFQDEAHLLIIRKILDSWETIVKEGAFAFDVEKTLGPAMAHVPPEMVDVLIRLLGAGVRVAIITGMPSEPLNDYLITPLLQRAGKEQDALQRLTIYSNGGANKMRVVAGQLVADEAYDMEHEVPLSIMPVIKDVLSAMARDKFGLGVSASHVAARWRAWIRGRFPNLQVDDSWVEGGPWEPEIIDAKSFWQYSRDGGHVRVPAIVYTRQDQGGYAVINILHLPEDPVDVRKSVEAKLARAAGEKGITMFRSYSGGVSAIDIISLATNKAEAMVDFVRSENLSPEWIYYFGDQWYRKRSGGKVIDGNDEVLARHPRLKGITTLSVGEELPENSRVSLHLGKGYPVTQKFLNVILSGSGVDRAASPLRQGKKDIPGHVRGREDLGGIDLDPRKMGLRIEHGVNGVPLSVDQQDWSRMNIQGFVPAIYEIAPINMAVFFGRSD